VPALHVLGTNGKGSVAALADHVLRRRGFRVGLYTSPHLVRITERVRTGGTEVSRAQLQSAVQAVLDAEQRVPPSAAARPLSFFEVLTLAAMVCFSAADLDFLVVEAGLGGRLDATRIVAQQVAAMTSIAIDHAELLGPDLAAIAGEKAAAIAARGVCVSATQGPEAMRVLAEHCRAIGAELEVVAPLERAPIGLAGDHQRMNAAVALRAVGHLLEHRTGGKHPVHSRALRGASDPLGAIGALGPLESAELDGVVWPARFERIAIKGGEAILDVAHNLAGMQALARCVEAEQRAARLDRRPLVLIGCQPDKDRAAMLALWEGVRVWWIDLGQPAEVDGVERRFVAIDALLWGALDRELERGTTVIVCGSHRLVGPVRAHLLGQSDRSDPSDPRAPSV
jgi:dihydrofolate synthase/folylpolyglutamate synthase